MRPRASRRQAGRAAKTFAAVSALIVALALPGFSPATSARGDQGLNANEAATADAIIQLLTGSSAPDWAKDNVDMVVTRRDDGYYVYAARGSIKFTRTTAPGGGWSYTVTLLNGVNPLDDQSNTALATLDEEWAAKDPAIAGCKPTSAEPDCRFFINSAAVSYPNAYERIVAEFDNSRTGDIAVVPWNSGPDSSFGGHGHLGVVQSRATLLVAGRGARRSPLSPQDEAALEIQNVDVAPTVAKALGVNPYFTDTRQPARTLNGSDSNTALLKRQDGEAQDTLLEQPLNVFVVVVDGLEPEDISPALTPTLWGLVEDGEARRYSNAQANMITETNANHAAMMTGSYGEVSGMVANAFYNTRAGMKESLERPNLMLTQTLFDAIEGQKPWLRTAAVMGKEKLKKLFDCTRPSATGPCGSSADNPEGIPVTHVRPDFLVGASTSFDPDETPGEPATGSGYAMDNQVMDLAVRLQGQEDPDFTFINLGLVDGMQHVAGAESAEGRAAVRNADQNIGRLVSYLPGSGKWQHSVVMVLADHSFQSTGDETTATVAGLTAGAGNPITPHVTGAWIVLSDLFSGACTSAGSQASFTTVSHGGSASVYVTDPAYDPYAGNLLTDVQKACLAELRVRATAHTHVDEALYRVPVEGNSHLIGTAHPDWHLNSPRAGELVLTSKDTSTFLDTRASTGAAITGNHGGPTARPIPFLIASGGSFLNPGTDTATVARPVDIAPTVAGLLGVAPPSGSQGNVRAEAFAQNPALATYGEPVANRAAIFIFDANNSVDVHTLLAQKDPQTGAPFVPCQQPPDPDDPVPNLRCLASMGTLTSYGSMSAWPSVTFPNHNTIGSGAYPGHHGIVNNRWYEREQQRSEHPIDPADPQNPVYFYTESLLSKDVETLHEAVHRTYGDWMGSDNHDPMKSGGAFTASVNEPSARGADFASLEQTNRLGEPLFPSKWARADELAEDTTQACLEQNPDGYGQETAIDHIGQGQARSLYDDPTHPAPKYLINNFALTDGAGHTFGPHTSCTLAAFRDADRRLGRILGAMRDAGVLGETLIVVTGDHGMENQRSGGFSGGNIEEELAALGYKLVQEDNFFYLMALDVEVTPAAFTAGQETTITVTVRDDDTGDPVGNATVTVTSGSTNTAGTTPSAAAPERTTLAYPREASDALDSAEDLTGVGVGDHPTIENPLRVYTDSSGRVQITFTPAAGGVVVTVAHDKFNKRELAFTS